MYKRQVFEQESGFVAHDLMRCAVTGGTKLKSYWVEVSSVIADGVLVPVSEFGGVKPEAGDECVLMGNTENPLRQNLKMCIRDREYGTFQQQKLAIAEEYAEKIRKAQSQGERLTLEKQRDAAVHLSLIHI